MLSSPDRDDDLLRERLRTLHERWPGDAWEDEPLRDVSRAIPQRADRRLLPLLRAGWRRITARLGASDSAMLLPERPDPGDRPDRPGAP